MKTKQELMMSGAEIHSFDGSQLKAAAEPQVMASPDLPNLPITYHPAGQQQLNLGNPTAEFKPDGLQLNRVAQARRQLTNVPQSRFSRDRYRVLREMHMRSSSAPTAPRAPSAAATPEANAQLAVSRYRQGIIAPMGAAAPKSQAVAQAPQPPIPQTRTVALGDDSPLIRGTRMALRLINAGMSPAGLAGKAVQAVAEIAEPFLATMPPSVAQTLKSAPAFNNFAAAMRPSMSPANGYRRKLLAPAA